MGLESDISLGFGAFGHVIRYNAIRKIMIILANLVLAAIFNFKMAAKISCFAHITVYDIYTALIFVAIPMFYGKLIQ